MGFDLTNKTVVSVSYWYFRLKCLTGILSVSSKLIFDQEKMILLYINIKAECKQAENGLIYLHEIQKHWKPPELYSNRVSLWKRGGDCDFIPVYFSFFIFTNIKLTTIILHVKLKLPFIHEFFQFFIHSFTGVKKVTIFLCSIP